MGTRADFYVGRGEKAEWVGSIAMDGYPEGRPADPKFGTVIKAETEDEFCRRVASLIEGCGHGTKPSQGWPWPWENSRLTDYAYAFDGCKVWASCFGSKWFDPLLSKPSEEDEAPLTIEDFEKAANADPCQDGKRVWFPDMKDQQNVTMGPRSGLIVCRIQK